MAEDKKTEEEEFTVENHPLTKQAEEGNQAAVDAREDVEGESDEDYQARVANVPGIFGEHTARELAESTEVPVPERADEPTYTSAAPAPATAPQEEADPTGPPSVSADSERADDAALAAPANAAAEERGSIENPSVATNTEVEPDTPVTESAEADENADAEPSSSETLSDKAEAAKELLEEKASAVVDRDKSEE